MSNESIGPLVMVGGFLLFILLFIPWYARKSGFPPYAYWQHLIAVTGAALLGGYTIFRVCWPELSDIMACQDLPAGSPLRHLFWCWHLTTVAALGFLGWVGFFLVTLGRCPKDSMWMSVVPALGMVICFFIIFNDHNRDVENARGCQATNGIEIEGGGDVIPNQKKRW